MYFNRICNFLGFLVGGQAFFFFLRKLSVLNSVYIVKYIISISKIHHHHQCSHHHGHTSLWPAATNTIQSLLSPQAGTTVLTYFFKLIVGT